MSFEFTDITELESIKWLLRSCLLPSTDARSMYASLYLKIDIENIQGYFV